MELVSLPTSIRELLAKLEAPQRLQRHLRLVHDTAYQLSSYLQQEWPQLLFDQPLFLVGAASHDIGKVRIPHELFNAGNAHEKAGRELLLAFGFSEKQSKFAETHGNWQVTERSFEELLVSLTDKIWKGERVMELEERVGREIASSTTSEYWEVYSKLDTYLAQLALDADQRILWQNAD